MRVVVLTTGTNNVAAFVDPLARLGHELIKIVYDVMPATEQEHLPMVVADHRPDWALFIGAIPDWHANVPLASLLARINARVPLVHLCSDGSEPSGWPHFEEYRSCGSFAVQVNMDGVVDERMDLTGLCPIDFDAYQDEPWEHRPVACGFAGKLYRGRQEIIDPLVATGAVTVRLRDASDDQVGYRQFIESCRVGINTMNGAGPAARPQVKARVLELAAAGCLVLEQAGSPASEWFVPGEDYLEYRTVEDVVEALRWASDNPLSARVVAQRLRDKVQERHHPVVFWRKVLEKAGVTTNG